LGWVKSGEQSRVIFGKRLSEKHQKQGSGTKSVQKHFQTDGNGDKKKSK